MELGFHDEVLFARYFHERLTLAEKVILQKRLATHHFNFGRLNWRRDGYSKEALQSIATAFTLAPVSSSFYIMQLSFNYLKNRYQLARNE